MAGHPRESYESGSLSERDLAPTWLAQIERWLAAAADADVREPGAMVLATADADGRPGARTVLLRGLDEHGLRFFTNHDSRKGRELAENARAAAVFPHYPLERQIVVDGTIKRLSEQASDAYFASRPWRSQLGALASPQSRVIESRESLDAGHAELVARYPEGSAVPRPPNWGGYLLVPQIVEFWQGRRDRLHDRLRYRHVVGEWIVERLAP